MKITCKKFGQLTPDELQQWTALSLQSRAMSPFFHPEYCRSLSEYRSQVEVGVLQDRDRVGFFPFERHSQRIGRPPGVKLADFQGIVGDVDVSPLDLLQGLGLTQLHFDHLLTEQLQVPDPTFVDHSLYLDLTDGFDAYLQNRRRSGNRSLSQIPRKERKLSREAGPVCFTWHDEDESALESLFAWKSAQRQRTGTANILEFPWVRTFLRELCQKQDESFQGVLSTLRMNDQLVAVHLGIATPTTFHYWFPAYNTDLHCYSPGQILIYRLAEACAAREIKRLDLGPGDESYKSSFANGSASIAVTTIDRNPLRNLARTSMYSVKQLIEKSPLKSLAQIPKRILRKRQNRVTMGAS